MDEFGDVAAYSVPLSDCSGFMVVGQPSLSVAAPFHITYVRFTDDGGVDKVQVTINDHYHHHHHHHRHISVEPYGLDE